MAFTDRFLRLPIMVVNTKQRELVGEDPEDHEMGNCILEINPRRIESYSETIPQKNFDPNNKCWTSVVMESGDSFLVRLTIDKFRDILNKHENK